MKESALAQSISSPLQPLRLTALPLCSAFRPSARFACSGLKTVLGQAFRCVRERERDARTHHAPDTPVTDSR